MSKQEVICGFCKRDCTPEEDVSFLKFPDGERRPVHVVHEGVQHEMSCQGIPVFEKKKDE